MTLETVRAALVCQLRSQAALSEEAHGPEDGLPYEPQSVERIEFQVPYELLESGFNQWPVPRGPGARSRPLGALYQVTVRCPQEREDSRPAWHVKWRRLCAQGGRHPEAVRVVEDLDVTDALRLRFSVRPAPACVLGHASAARTMEAEAVAKGWWLYQGEGPGKDRRARMEDGSPLPWRDFTGTPDDTYAPPGCAREAWERTRRRGEGYVPDEPSPL
ncbi:hypothetical protein OOK31_06905 [Streptomyces sp. NBC_00249]|uniref:VMAP-C domain-containing protein n=1 Tax=Streptomyces sp. NBC_00249 TaxID=2975690 RepID=UPI0022571484|nr:hypothetical protein [Streptomyces sp. NBC_00249]MCX5193622.1 hypothetical protein [Streptomyces sp. NBC_00249]